MQLKPMSIGNIYLYSDMLPPSDHPSTGVTVVRSIDDAIRRESQAERRQSSRGDPRGSLCRPVLSPRVEA